MREPSKLYIEKRTTKSGKEVFYITERTVDTLGPVVICLCQTEAMANRVLSALLGGQKRPAKP